MITGRGQVPHFSLKPHPALVTATVLVLLVGALLALSFFSQEDGTGTYKQYGILVCVLAGITSICLLIAATYKMWFPHLWKKNSTHKRHHHHSHHHPVNQHPKATHRKPQR